MRFFKSLFKNKKNLYPIVLIGSPSNSVKAEDLILQINQIDLKIKNISKEVLKAQLVRFRSLFSKKSNLLIDFQKRYFETRALKSADWHQQKLFELIKERKVLEIQLDRLSGNIWGRRLKAIYWGLVIGFTLFLSILIVILFILTTLYSLPIILFIIISYLIVKKSR